MPWTKASQREELDGEGKTTPEAHGATSMMAWLTSTWSTVKRSVFRVRRIRARITKVQVNQILSMSGNPNFRRSETEFDTLQKSYPCRDEYKYDPLSIWERASIRCINLLNLSSMDKVRKDVLEVGCGDGVTGALLASYGHNATLLDLEDWRAEYAKSIPFLKADLGVPLAIDDNSFDLIYSYNTFEHIPNPKVASMNLCVYAAREA